MSTELIRAVLGVPAGPWPPDHYTLLGLERGTADPAAIEASVLERMERLRRYQLAQPDPVTDAMNRLAQALICLTDPGEKGAYDAGLGVVPGTPAPPAEPPSSGEPVPASRAGSTTPVLPAEPPVTPERPARRSPRADPRRERIRSRVQARRLRTAWAELGRFLADESRPWTSRTGLVDLVQGLWRIRALTAGSGPSLTGGPDGPGAQVLAQARQPLRVGLLATVTPTRRHVLAVDWQLGDAHLRQVEAGFRRQTRARPLRVTRRFARRAARAAMGRYLDVLWVLVGLAALGLALARTRW